MTPVKHSPAHRPTQHPVHKRRAVHHRSNSFSGLNADQRARARRIIMEGVHLLLANPAAVHYTQGPQRWEGIDRRLLIRKGQRPSHGDCSSTHTWLLWNALGHEFGLGDIVNGANWHAGYTGTLLAHGKLVRHIANAKVGDAVLYGRGFPGEHVATYVGGGYVFSHGGEAGPFKLPWNYRPDFMQARRYI